MSTEVTDHATERKNGDKPAKQKFGLVLQGGGALGAYEVGAVEYLYERGMECAIVTGASAGAIDAAALAGATQYPPRVLRKLWEKSPSIRRSRSCPTWSRVPQWLTRLWFSYIPTLLVPGMYRPRLDVWNLPDWTYVPKPTMGKTLDALLDWDQIRDPGTCGPPSRPAASRTARSPTSPTSPRTSPAEEPEYQPVQFGAEHVQASGSFPGGFPWTTIQNRAYWDGGLTDNTPLKPILDNLTEDEAASMPIYMIDVNVAAAPRPGSLYGVSQRMLELLVRTGCGPTWIPPPATRSSSAS